MPRIYRPLGAIGSHSRTTRSTPRSKMETGVRDDDPVQEMIAASNMMYGGGTHRSPQCKDSCRTPGPGAYRTVSSFPLSGRDEAPAARCRLRAPSWRMTSRAKTRVVDIGNPFAIVPPAVGIFRAGGAYMEGADVQPAPQTAPCRTSVNTMPPVTPRGIILKGHGGDLPKGHGLPF
eukprot:TRINITY_DN100543_c0_g1_i1.p2 TRINITY_DN100543_c0_g1~~TRINITY_DN100543_c0_g1_i1.p2  ORF type:complete len:176 (-),score=6.04 TRINITY_DN100543_c0_g1_i1:224-751(-)